LFCLEQRPDLSSCGTLPAPRKQTLEDIALLRTTQHATLEEVMAFIARKKLDGLGCGLVDMALLTSTLLTPGARLSTLNRRLAELAERVDVGYHADVH
jgi:hypothetical protein